MSDDGGIDIVIIPADDSPVELLRWKADEESSNAQDPRMEDLEAQLGEFESVYTGDEYVVYASEYPPPDAPHNMLFAALQVHLGSTSPFVVLGKAVMHIGRGSELLARVKEWLDK